MPVQVGAGMPELNGAQHLRDRLWLFWRGGGWNPTFSYTTDRLTWTPARELVYRGGGERPYTKYVGDGNRRIHGIFTDGHPMAFKNSLYYLRYENRGLFAANGRRLGTLDNVPLHVSKLDRIYKYSDAGGRAWGHDIALSDRGGPRVVYTRRIGNRDTFYYAYFNGTNWVSRKIVEAGPMRPSFTSGGATLDHEDPRRLPLAQDGPVAPGGTVVYDQQRPHMDVTAADQRAQPLLHPSGLPARAHGCQPRALLARRRNHDRLHELQDAHPRPGLLADR